MKKAKIMLTAVGVFAIVGGALAVKASKFTTDKIFTPNANGICNVQVLGKKTTNVGTTLVSASPVVLTTTCPRTFTTIGL